MNREEIISKGFYTYPQLKGFICVKQYILLRKGEKKYLALRLENEHSDTATGLTLNVRQYDSNSRFLAVERVDVSGIKVSTDGTFNIKDKIALHKECERFEVDVISMTFGSYKYVVRNGEVIPVFSLDEEKKDTDKTEIARKMRKGSHKVNHRNRISPKLFIILSAVIFVLISAFAVLQILNFAKTEVVFTLDNIEYSFETDNRKDGPIRIDRYKGIMGNVVIPETIEGHKVARISANAFSGSWISGVTVKGETVIEEGAFANCWFLKSAELEKVVSVGDNAFKGCSALESVTMNSATVSLGAGAFEKCTSLKTVKLPETLTEVKSRAFFGCSALEDLVIPNSVTSIGESALAGCRRLKNLAVPFIGETAETPKTLEHFFFDGEKVAAPTSDLLNLTIGNFDRVLPETFKDCKYLGSIAFEKEVVEIGDRAFYGCTNLSNVDITDALVSLGESAFEKCGSLKSVSISANLKDIKARTFADCATLVDIVIPNGLMTVGENAFEDCIALTVLKIPSTVNKIGNAALVGCTSLTDLTVPFLGANESEPSGVDTWFLEPNQNLKKVTVLRGKTISDGAFKNYMGLEEVHLPDVITAIGKEAFLNCAALKEFNVPMGVAVIEEQSFKGCVSLSKLSISNKVAKISTRAFEGCVSLSSVEMADMLHTIEPYAFSGCVALEELKLPANLSVISEGMLLNCTSLKSVTLPTILDKVEERAFANCGALTEISFPPSVSYLAKEAFAGCDSITELVIPSSVMGMGEKIFSGCTSLTSLTIPDLRTGDYDIGSLGYFFEGETQEGIAGVPESLTSVELTDAESIAPSAFANCENIEKIVLPVSVNTVGALAFKDCSSLKTLTIPVYVRGIGQHAFTGCTSLKELSVPFINGGNKDESGFKYWFEEIPASLETVRITNTSRIPTYAFSECPDIKEVIFDSEIEFIGEYAFYNCINLNSITIPRTLSYIGDNAFEACYRLYEVTNNSDLRITSDDTTCLGKYVLAMYEPGESADKRTFNGFEFLHADSGEWYLIGYTGNGKNWDLPDSSVLGSYKIANYVFYRNETVESVFIPWNVDGFGVGMFAYCSNLKNVEWHKNTAVSIIPQSAFASCSKLENVDLPICIQSIGDSAFENCQNLMQIKLYSNLGYIGVNAFAGCTGMLEVVNNSDTLEINVGEEANGCIAQYALYVGTNATLLEESITNEGVTYNFARVLNEWYLHRIDMNGAETDTVKLPELSKFENAKYSIIKSALDISASKFVIPTSVESIADESLAIVCAELSTIYYMGSEEAWIELVDASDAAIYYYAKCIHRDGQWNYDENGNINTKMSEVQTKEIKKATCSEQGEIERSCAVCKTVLGKQTVSKLEHSFDANGTCTVCKAKK